MSFLPARADPPFVKPGPAAQRAHDALLEIAPEGQVHEPCELCPDPIKKEVAQVADANDRVYTEVEHLALMADAVTRETASLVDAKTGLETTVSEKAARVDVLEAEKAALETKVSELEKALDDFKTEVERAKEIETAKQERVKAVKAANDQLPDTYFTDERIQAWAEMDEAVFAIVLDGLTAAAGVGAKETAAFAGGESPTGDKSKVTVGSIFAARRGEKN